VQRRGGASGRVRACGACRVGPGFLQRVAPNPPQFQRRQGEQHLGQITPHPRHLCQNPQNQRHETGHAGRLPVNAQPHQQAGGQAEADPDQRAHEGVAQPAGPLKECLEGIFQDQPDYQDFSGLKVFAEFFGPGLFAGMHRPGEPKRLVPFDVEAEGFGLVGPRQFVDDFGHLPIARVVYEGRLTGQFAEDVRAGKKLGKVLGHRFGVGNDVLLGYRDARFRIYLPAFRWVLENRLADEVGRLRHELTTRPVVLLDYETNGDVEDLSRSLSHAALLKYHLEGTWPAGASADGSGQG
jgi:hypothetical protein